MAKEGRGTPTAKATAKATDGTPALPEALLLVARVGGKETARLLLEQGTAFIGSDPGNDLVVDEATVSRRHLEAQLRVGGVWVRDSGSTNGTRYQGARVSELLVPVGGVLRLGKKAEVRVDSAERTAVVRLGSMESRAPACMQALETLARAAGSDISVLVEGETGAGKELAARALHDASPRAAGPFEVVDCGALPPQLAGAELFGHVKGAFTGADRDRPGAFERARGGTVFLDEIGELPSALQPLLLRVLERREVRRVGGDRYTPVDVRIVSATNRDLAAEAKAGRFRSDLLHRLSVVPVRLPPLRERREDIPALTRVLLDGLGTRAAGFTLSPETLAAFAAYPWPGNVRELRNVIERAVALSADRPLDAGTMGLDPGAEPGAGVEDYRVARKHAMDAFEKDYLMHLLRRCGRNVSRAARESGLDRVYLHRMLRKHGIKVREL